MLKVLLTRAVHRTKHFIDVRRRKASSYSFTTKRRICYAHCSKHSASLDLMIE